MPNPALTLSIEYAHIYTNNHIGQEQKLSLKILESLTDDVPVDTTSLVVMVDDYSFPDPSFDYDQFTSWLKDHGFGPDVVFRESQLIPLCDEVLTMIKDQKLRDNITDYIRSKKYPCSLFIVAWYWLRLGVLTHPAFPQRFTASKLINILPASFKPFEDKALEIIAASIHPETSALVQYRFFEGRLIA